MFQQMVPGELDIHLQKNESGPLSYPVYIYKNELKMDQNYKNLRRK